MQFYPQSMLGFAIDEERAKELGLEEYYQIWVEDGDHEPFCIEYETQFGIYPQKIQHFGYEHSGDVEVLQDLDIQPLAHTSGYVQSLDGFEYNNTYVLFSDGEMENSNWLPMLQRLEDDYQIFLEEGNWLELE